jgi:hypothetical protein
MQVTVHSLTQWAFDFAEQLKIIVTRDLAGPEKGLAGKGTRQALGSLGLLTDKTR